VLQQPGHSKHATESRDWLRSTKVGLYSISQSSLRNMLVEDDQVVLPIYYRRPTLLIVRCFTNNKSKYSPKFCWGASVHYDVNVENPFISKSYASAFPPENEILIFPHHAGLINSSLLSTKVRLPTWSLPLSHAVIMPELLCQEYQ
jgi:hypothetical protein